MNKKLSIGFLPPINGEQQINLPNKVQSVTFRNNGTSTIIFNHGYYSLAPGETLHLSAVDNNDYLQINGLHIGFDTTVGPVNSLQTLLLVSNSNC